MMRYIKLKNRDLIISTSMSKYYTRLRAYRNKIRGIKMIAQLYKARLDMLKKGQVTMKVKELIDEY